MTLPKILCVDDEPRVLEGLQRILRKSYEVVAASGAEAALVCLDREGPFEVVVSDMRMPGMNGAALLAECRRRAPETTRLLLTGQTEIDAAIAAINQGQIFRFLTKPCPPESLAAALEAAVAQHRLVTSERVLLEQTLVGSVRALTEVLALVNPEAFGPRMRQHARARAVAEALNVPDAWHVEVASMLASVGYVVLPSKVAAKVQVGAPLSAVEAEMASQVPGVVERVLAHIPRLENVRRVLQDFDSVRVERAPPFTAPLGARILAALRDLAALEAREGDPQKALGALRSSKRYDVELIAALEGVCQASAPDVRAHALADLRIGMTLAADVQAKTGMLLVARGQEVTAHLLQRIRNFHVGVGVVEPILCEVSVAAP